MIKNLENLKYRESALSKEVQVADIASEPFEAKVLFYKKGTKIPPHHHSSETLHIVLEGEIEVEAGRQAGGTATIKSLGDYKCGGFEYRGTALRDTYVLLIQTPGTQFVKS
jgi:hypothetical protein